MFKACIYLIVAIVPSSLYFDVKSTHTLSKIYISNHLSLSPDVLLRVPSGFVHRHLHRHLRDIQQAALLSLSSSTTFLLVTIVLYLFEISYSSSPILIIRRYSYLCSAVQSNCVTGGKPLIFDENLNFDEFDNAFDNSDGMVLIRIT